MTTTQEPEKSVEQKARDVLHVVYKGFYNCPGTLKIDKRSKCWSVCVYDGLSTFDNDTLTRLVLAAHHHCVRVELANGGPGRIKIRFSQRKRHSEENPFCETHPTIETAIETIRKTDHV